MSLKFPELQKATEFNDLPPMRAALEELEKRQRLLAELSVERDEQARAEERAPTVDAVHAARQEQAAIESRLADVEAEAAFAERRVSAVREDLAPEVSKTLKAEQARRLPPVLEAVKLLAEGIGPLIEVERVSGALFPAAIGDGPARVPEIGAMIRARLQSILEMLERHGYRVGAKAA